MMDVVMLMIYDLTKSEQNTQKKVKKKISKKGYAVLSLFSE